MSYVPLFQERWKARPFWMLVGCVLVNRATWKVAEPIHGRLVRECSGRGTPHRDGAANLHNLPEPYLIQVLKPLGLASQRAGYLRQIARAFKFSGYVSLDGRWEPAYDRITRRDVLKLPGCGKYAADSWAIFVEGKRDVEPTDKRLLEFLREEKRRKRTA